MFRGRESAGSPLNALLVKIAFQDEWVVEHRPSSLQNEGEPCEPLMRCLDDESG